MKFFIAKLAISFFIILNLAFCFKENGKRPVIGILTIPSKS
jgi:hypothetical protein